MKWIAMLTAFLASCAYNQDNSVQVGNYRIAHDPGCMSSFAQMLWYIVIPLLVVWALFTWIRNNR